MAEKAKRTAEQQARIDAAREHYERRREGRPRTRWIPRTNAAPVGSLMPVKDAAKE